MTRKQRGDVDVQFTVLENKLKRAEKRAKETSSMEPPRKKRPEVKIPKEQKEQKGPIHIDVDYIRNEQQEDPQIQRLWQLACKGKVDKPAPTQEELEDAENLTMINGVIAKKEELPTGEVRSRIVIPVTIQKEVTLLTHRMNAHPGVNGTLAILKQYH